MSIRFVRILILITLVSCGGSTELVQNPPFKVGEAAKIDLESGGYSIRFTTEGLPRNLTFETLYFETYKARVLWDENGSYYAEFPIFSSEGDRVLSLDMTEESNNPLPLLPVETPYEIKENEALLNYKLGEDSYFTILTVD